MMPADSSLESGRGSSAAVETTASGGISCRGIIPPPASSLLTNGLTSALNNALMALSTLSSGGLLP